jgi:hypothetical protein
MKKNILKKFIILFSLGFIFVGYNFTFAIDEIIPIIDVVPDTTAPVITLNGSAQMDLIIGEVFIDPGTIVNDNLDDSINVISIGTVDVNTIGTYIITYTATDAAGNGATPVIRTVNIILLLNSIEIKIPSTKLTYVVGDLLDISGLEVIGNYNDKSIKNENITTSNITGFDSSSPAIDQILTISVGGKNTTYKINIESLVLKEHLIIRNGDIIIYDNIVLFPEAGYIDIPDSSGTLHPVNTQSVLGLLYSIDQNDDSFSISDLSYSDNYKSFLLNCIKPNISEPLCYNWQYAVNNYYPYFSMDNNIIVGNENIYLFFGPQNRVLLNKNSINTNEKLIVTSQKYDYKTNLWVERLGVTVGVTKPDPLNPWAPNDEINLLVNSSGIANFLGIPEGEYNIGIKEDYYWPTEKLTVTKYISENTGGGGGPTPPSVEKTFSVSNAIDFLYQNKNSDGSFGSSMYTDWAAIGIAVGNNSSLKLSISNYLKLNPISSSTVTDYERRAMAIMALGINPYIGTDVDYISKIITAYDGIQIGDPSLSNDDIFGLIVLSNAGYTKNDEIINNVVSFVIKNQSSNGSWGSIDMTAAAIESLNSFKSLSGVSEAISKGELYLITEQKIDGGFGNSSSTSWAIQALSLNNSYNIEVDKAIKYLAVNQHTDGGMGPDDVINNRIWATSYAIPAVLKLHWNSILNSFSKEENITPLIIPEENNYVNEILENKEIEKINLIEEEIIIPIKNEEITATSNKLIKNKNEIISKINKPLVEDKKPSENLLSANAIGSAQNPNTFFSIINFLIEKIKVPFSWLFIHLIF